MADITANFTIYKGHHHSDLKHIATVFRQSNFRDSLQLIKQKPFNANIFVNPRKVKSVIEFLVPFKPLNNIRRIRKIKATRPPATAIDRI